MIRSILKEVWKKMLWIVKLFIDHFIQLWIASVSIRFFWISLKKGLMTAWQWFLFSGIHVPVWVLMLIPIVFHYVLKFWKWGVDRSVIEYDGLNWKKDGERMIPLCPQCNRKVFVEFEDYRFGLETETYVHFRCPKHGHIRPSEEELMRRFREDHPEYLTESGVLNTERIEWELKQGNPQSYRLLTRYLLSAEDYFVMEDLAYKEFEYQRQKRLRSFSWLLGQKDLE